MAKLMTGAEVITLAFDRSVESTKIKDEVIASAQQRHIMPILGEDFYDAVVADTVTYADLITQIKPMLAQFVRYYSLPQIYVETGSVGMAIIQGQNRQQANNNDYEKQRQNALDLARLHGEVLRKWLEDNESSYPLYFRGSNPQERVKIRGGIIMKVKDPWFDPAEDDYTINLDDY